MWIRMSLAGLVVAGSAAPAFADGAFYARGRAITSHPSMTSQAAVVGYRDGVETLVIESAVHADGSPLAWLVPLPSEPTVIRACQPGAVRSTLDAAAPDAVSAGDARQWVTDGITLLVLAVIWGLAMRALPPRYAFDLVLGTVMLAVLALLLLPRLGAASGPDTVGPRHGVMIERSIRAGSYEVAVLRAARVEDLEQWLTEREFDLPEQARPVVTRLIRDGWVFCAARVDLAAGHVAPHPVRFEFPSDRIIYPMQLTAAAGGQLALDLVVLADTPVRAAGLDVWLEAPCEPPYRPGGPEWWRSRSIARVGHPDVADLVASQEASDSGTVRTWVTRLVGQIDLSQRPDDILLTSVPSPADGQRREVTLGGSSDLAARAFAAILWGLTITAVVVLPVLRSECAGWWRRWFVRVALVVAAVMAGHRAWVTLAPMRVAEFTIFADLDVAEFSGLLGDVIDDGGSAADVRQRLLSADTRAISRERAALEGRDEMGGWLLFDAPGGLVVARLIDGTGQRWFRTRGDWRWSSSEPDGLRPVREPAPEPAPEEREHASGAGDAAVNPASRSPRGVTGVG